MDVDEEDDEVVRELDVYVTEEDLSLYLLQFPLRPCFANPPEVIDARFKPQHAILELNVNHEAMDAPLRMLSTKVAQDVRFGVGLLSGESLHITPLSEVLQMRPSFLHLAAPGKPHSHHQQQQADNGQSDDDDHEDVDDGDSHSHSHRNSHNRNHAESKPALQKVVLQKMESERMQSARLQSFSYLKSLEDAEVFQKLRTHDIESVESDGQFDKCYYNAK